MKKDDYSIESFVNILGLMPHPEGGFYKETYRSTGRIQSEHLEGNFEGQRNYSTAIYFLLTSGNFSAFHRIKQDELWHFYEGQPLNVHIIHQDGAYSCLKLGPDLKNGEQYQGVVPAGAWFASAVSENGNYSLVGCTVAPGFDFKDFEMAKKTELLQAYPQHSELISKYCRD
jgi:predicted cupin superfamily sugar epimerase